MNGFKLLVLLAMASQIAPGQVGLSQTLPGQIGQAPLGQPGLGQAPLPGQLPMQDNVSFQSTEYGWKVNPKTNEFEYIVQLSSDLANQMVREDKEFTSEIHPDVAIRIRRVVVRIGTEPIVSLPLSEVRLLPPVAAPIDTNVQSEVGKGRYAQLESGTPAELKNVSGGTPPPSLSTGGVGASLSDQGLTQPDLLAPIPDSLKNAESLLAQNTLDSMSNAARNAFPGASGNKYNNTATTPPTGTVPNLNTGIAGGLGTGVGSGFPAGPTTGSNLPPATLPNTPALPGALAGTGGTTQLPNHGGIGYGQSNQGAYPTSTPNYTAGPTTSGNFGAAPRGTAMQPFNNTTTGQGTNTGNYTTSPLNGNLNYGQGQATSPYVQHTDPPSYLPSNRIADNRALPTTSGAGSNMATSSYGTGTGSASDMHSGDQRFTNNTAGRSTQYPYQSTSATEYPQRTGMDNIVPVMFVLSLVVNFYLGMLIRRLLARYRNLLASVRSQAV